MRPGLKKLVYRYWKLWLLLAILRTTLLGCIVMFGLAGIIDNVDQLWMEILFPETYIPNVDGDLIGVLIFADTVVIGVLICAVHNFTRPKAITDSDIRGSDWPPAINRPATTTSGGIDAKSGNTQEYVTKSSLADILLGIAAGCVCGVTLCVVTRWVSLSLFIPPEGNVLFLYMWLASLAVPLVIYWCLRHLIIFGKIFLGVSILTMVVCLPITILYHSIDLTSTKPLPKKQYLCPTSVHRAEDATSLSTNGEATLYSTPSSSDSLITA